MSVETRPAAWPKGWTPGKTWRVGASELTEQVLWEVWKALPQVSDTASANILELFPGADSLTDRRVDRALQMLRKAKLAQFIRGSGVRGKSGRWVRQGGVHAPV